MTIGWVVPVSVSLATPKSKVLFFDHGTVDTSGD